MSTQPAPPDLVPRGRPAGPGLVVPRRTDLGVAALHRRNRDLTPRQRTVLFLVDGRRSIDIVLALAAQAGAQTQDFTALLAKNMIEAPGLPDPSVLTESSLLPSAQSLQGDSSWSQPPLTSLMPSTDGPFTEARDLLIRAVRKEAPLAGTLTLMKLRRAATRADLEVLLDEVEQRLRKPHRRIIAAQTLRHVRHLLTLPPNSRLDGR